MTRSPPAAAGAEAPSRSEVGPTKPALEVASFPGGAFAENGYLVRHVATNRVVVVDPGAAAPAMVRVLKEWGGSLDAIYLTHAHFDHVEGIPIVRKHADVPIHLHASDQITYDRAEARGAMFGLKLPGPLPPPDRVLAPGEAVPVGDLTLEVRFAPGHAPGHVILYSEEAQVALVGDVIFQGSIGRTDIPGGDFLQLIDSIRREVLTLPDATRLLSGHGPETTVERERMGNPFLISQMRGGLA
ncbi:MAG: MBL fold metallo-hydrolase [Gemmatimonadetes bacterium]|nr:MBL fold metallo-hydrolase [Gemmatimonadota bacterium]